MRPKKPVDYDYGPTIDPPKQNKSSSVTVVFPDQVTMNSLWFGLDLDDATAAHRLHHQLVPNEVRVEQGFDEVG